MFGIGRRLKKAGRRIEGTTRQVASAAKSAYTHPVSSVKGEAARVESQARGTVETAAKQLEGEVKNIGDIGPIGAAKRGVQRQLQGSGTPEAPVAPEPAPMPIPDEELSLVARRRARARRKGARGSSILSGDEGTLG